ncbi:H-NS histone family protein [Aquincola sp. MAHUQ-54]|uniref:H-NS histone family protein n=1 Tax=Aquincola agrisoli TaxID=3119538 RepID=A0AAW9QN13_9BURK
MATLQELLAQKASLEKQIADTQREERANAIAKVKSIMSEHGLTVADLSQRAPSAPRAEGTRKVAAKYRNGETGETWSGRGLQPKWLKAALAEGKQLTDFAV